MSWQTFRKAEDERRTTKSPTSISLKVCCMAAARFIKDKHSSLQLFTTVYFQHIYHHYICTLCDEGSMVKGCALENGVVTHRATIKRVIKNSYSFFLSDMKNLIWKLTLTSSSSYLLPLVAQDAFSLPFVPLLQIQKGKRWAEIGKGTDYALMVCISHSAYSQ